MCQNLNIQNNNSLGKLKGDICMDSKNKVFFVIDPHQVHTFPTVATGVSYARFNHFGNYLRSINAIDRETAISKCELEILTGLFEEFEEVHFTLELSSILVDIQIGVME